ncbi:MAG TPA: response regulator [Candidatus Polarisedimenticolaceae bacterium]|nr:response regulator [Candidatus Polarisedimenticolaceae bacterium]
MGEPLSRVLLVDPSGDWLAAIHALLAEDADLEVVGWARTGAEAVARAAELWPDLVLLELELPDTSGLRTVPRLKRLPRPPLVLLLTAHRRTTVGVAAILAGADGCLRKPQLGHRLLPILRELRLR